MKSNGLVLFALSLVTIQAQVRQDLHAKLLTPIASYSKPGQYFEIRTGPPVEFGMDSILAEGTILRGKIRSAKGVGIGIRRERAQVELEFQRCAPPGHPAAACSVELIEIENAREQVARGNRIHGILAASNPNSLFQGIWFRPAGAFFHRSPTGLTGPVGALQSRIAPNPLGAAIAITTKLLLFSLPNSDVELPTGTELIVRVQVSDVADHALLPVASPLPQSETFEPHEHAYFQGIPTEIKNASSNVVSDRINFVFRGTRQAVATAFAAAGWTTADALTRKSFAKSYAAFTSLRGYETAPVSPLFYQHRQPDLVYQKSFNSMSKRHHIRFWRIEDPTGTEEPLWVAAATHDIGIAFDWNRLSLTHRVDEFLDRERSKVLNDLSAAQCLSRLTLLDRPALSGGTTDGKLAIATIASCEPVAGNLAMLARLQRPRNPMPIRVIRRLVLETRQYVTRGNAYYWAYRGVRKAVVSLRPPHLRNGHPANAFAQRLPSLGSALSSPVANGLR